MSDVIVEKINQLEGVYYPSERNAKPTASALACLLCSRQHGGEGTEVKKCLSCAVAAYCSNECRKKDWPKHKRHCHEASTSREYARFFVRLMHNPFILHYLRVALIHKSGLLEDPSPNKCHRVTISSLLLPVQNNDLVRLALGDWSLYEAADNRAIRGRLHLSMPDSKPAKKIDVYGKSRSSLWFRKDDSDRTISLWKQGKKLATEAGRPDSPIVVVTFAYEVEVDFVIEVTAGAFDTAQGNPPPLASLGRLIGVADKPTDAHKATAIINQYIDEDSENKLRLRKDMRKYDRDLIRDLAMK